MSTATANDILIGARARSVANDPKIATKTELLAALRAILRSLYARAAQIDPLYFASPVTVSPDGAGWDRPSAIDVVRVEKTDGTKVTVVPMDDRTEVAYPPRIYRVGQKYFTVGEDDDPDDAQGGGDDLVFYVAERFTTALDDTDDPLPAAFPAEHEELLKVELAIYLSLKDKARGDMEALTNERDHLLEDFVAAIEGSDRALESRFAAGATPTGTA